MSAITRTNLPGDLSAACRWEDDGGLIPPSTVPDLADQHWRRIATALTDRLPDLAGRDDVLVTCRRTTLSGAPAAFFPTLAEIEVHTKVFTPAAPATIRPDQPGDEDRYPVAWGALIHEAAHAAHSRWTTPAPDLGTRAEKAALLLEESRVEGGHLARRPTDRTYLRAAARRLVMDGCTGTNLATRWGAGTAAALILARRDVGVFDPAECTSLHTALTRELGADLLARLATIWTDAHRSPDGDADAMLAHGRAWCAALGADPAARDAGHAGGADDGTRAPSNVGRAVAETTNAVASREKDNAKARVEAEDVHRARQEQVKADRSRRTKARVTAKQVFRPGGGPVHPGGRESGASPIVGTRPPHPGEKRAAAGLARILRTAGFRECVETVTTSAVPPGRLNMRGALARDAQRAAGALPTAEPWVAVHRAQTPNPPLRVGIAVDVSASMGDACAPIASAAWILARAVALTDASSQSATVAFGKTLTAVTSPGRNPKRVTEFAAHLLGHNLGPAIDALAAGLDLERPRTGRLLVIATDARHAEDELAAATERIAAMNRAGCAVLQLAFDSASRRLPGVSAVRVASPADAINAIGNAAVAAIAAAR